MVNNHEICGNSQKLYNNWFGKKHYDKEGLWHPRNLIKNYWVSALTIINSHQQFPLILKIVIVLFARHWSNGGSLSRHSTTLISNNSRVRPNHRRENLIRNIMTPIFDINFVLTSGFCLCKNFFPSYFPLLFFLTLNT